jgi:hypothetical protein
MAAEMTSTLLNLNLSAPEDSESSPENVAYINKLPIELLGDIATVASSRDPDSIWTFASVCRYWHIAALSTPNAWSSFYFSSESGVFKTSTAIYREKLQFNFSKLRLWLERAKSVSLQVTIKTRTSIPHLIEFQQSLQTKTFPWNQVGKLHLTTLPDDFDELFPTLDGQESDETSKASPRFGMLESLAVENHAKYEDLTPTTFTHIANVFLGTLLAANTTPNFLRHPPLRHLSLYGISIDETSFVFIPQLGQLQTLRLVKCKTRDCSLMDLIFPAQKHLISLRIDIMDDFQLFSPDQMSKTPVGNSNDRQGSTKSKLFEFPLLDELSITLLRNYNPPGLSNPLARISCPSLTRLTADDSILSPNTPFQTGFPKLKYLSIQSYGSFGSKKVLQILPSLNGTTVTHLTLYQATEPNYV